MGALTASLIAIVAIGLGWATIEIACKPCLEQGRQAIDRNLNPDYDPDDNDDIRAPLNPPLPPPPPASLVKDASDSSASSTTTVVKIV